MSTMTAGGLWDWACAVYADEAVATAGLKLQDRHDQSLSLLLWAAWAGPTEASMAAEAAEIARGWDRSAIAPLRAVRRGLKAPQAGVDAAAREAVRAQVHAAELAAEKALLDALGRLRPERRAAAAQALRLAAQAWGHAVPADALADFAQMLEAADEGPRQEGS